MRQAIRCQQADKRSDISAVRMVSLKTLAGELDAHRSSVRRWLQEAGIKPVAIGCGRNGAIRYLRSDVEGWLQSLEHVE